MNNIEKLARTFDLLNEQGRQAYYADDTEYFLGQLEDFAKAYASSLQSSEPVAYLSNTLHLAYMADEILEENKQRYKPLFTYPPASVSLEKYNKLLEILKRMDGWLEVRNLGGLMPDEKALIAEAEGEEG